MSAIDSIFSRDFSFRRGGKKEGKREEKLVCLLQLGNEMFARETIVGGTMVGGVTARGWKRSTSQWATRSSFNWVNRVPRVKWTRINQRQIIESLAVNRDRPTFHQLSVLDVYSEWRNSIPFFRFFSFFTFFIFSPPPKGWFREILQSRTIIKAREFSSLIRNGFPKRTDISPLPLIGGFPRNALDDPTFNPSRFAYKCNQLCPR